MRVQVLILFCFDAADKQQLFFLKMDKSIKKQLYIPL
jgi:hypothetical protein